MRVLSAVEADIAAACAGAKDAASFFAFHGIDAGATVEMLVLSALPEHAGGSAVGCYLDEERRIYVLSFAAFKELGTWFGLPIDRALYRSVIAHEVAHALAARHFRVEHPSIQAKEYIAYVVMFATMIPDHRDRILAQFPGAGYEVNGRMNTLIYMMDPLRFGVRAYRHFLNPAHGSRYLRDILAGDALAE